MAIEDYLASIKAPQSNTPMPTLNQPSGATMLSENLKAFSDPNSELMQQAARRGIEYAATRGGVNSSIAAGASQRSALDTATQLASQATEIDVNRQNTQQQAAFENWLSQQNFNRTFQAQLGMLPVQNSFNMLSAIQEYALQDPALYTPDVVSGYSNFFQKNMENILAQYFGGTDA